MTPKISLAIAVFAAVATVALRAASRRPVPGTERVSVTVSTEESRPRTAVTPGPQDDAGYGTARPPGPTGQPASVVVQTQQVFHELHADGFNALCAVCHGQ